MCFSAACVARIRPDVDVEHAIHLFRVDSRTVGDGRAALLTRTSNLPKVATVFSTAAATASASMASA